MMKILAGLIASSFVAFGASAAQLNFSATGQLSENGFGAYSVGTVSYDISGYIDIGADPLYEEYGLDYAYYELEGQSQGVLDTTSGLFETQGIELQNNLMIYDEDAAAAGVADGTSVDLFSIVLTRTDSSFFYLFYLDFFFADDALVSDALSDLTADIFASAALGGRAFLFREDLATADLDSIEGDILAGSVSSVPIPSAAWLFASALLGLYARSKHCRLLKW